MKKSKRIWSFLLALCLIVTQLPATALAADGSPVIVGGQRLDTDKPYNNDGEGGIEEGDSQADCNVYLEDTGEKYVLTLNNANIYGVTSDIYRFAGIYYIGSNGDKPLEIVLEGSNTISAGDSGSNDTDEAAIFVVDESLIISGSGELNAYANKSESPANYLSAGICTRGTGCDLIINGGTIKAIAGDSAAYNAGIYSDGNLIINKGTVTATGGKTEDGPSVGIYTFNSGTELVINGGTVTAYGGEAGGSCGIYSMGQLSVTGGTIDAYGGKAERQSCGIGSFYDIEISGDADIDAAGGKSDGSSFGIGADNITISEDAYILATGGEALQGISHGIGAVSNLNVNISDEGFVQAQGGKGETSYGIGVNEYVNISGGGIVQAFGGEAEISSYGVGSTGDVTINGGYLEAKGGMAVCGSSFGVGVTNLDGDGTEVTTGGAIYVTNGGTLYGFADEYETSNGKSYGVAATNGITVEDEDSVLTGTSGKAQGSCGTYSGKDLKVNGGSVDGISGTATMYNSFGIGIRGSLIVTEGSVTGTSSGSEAYENSYGIGCEGINLSGTGMISGYSGEAVTGSSEGVGSTKDIEMNGGVLIGMSGVAQLNSFGVGTNGNINNSGGTIKGTGNESKTGNSYGVGTDGNISVSNNGMIDGQGGSGELSLGIGAYGSIDFSESSLIASGDNAPLYAVGNMSIEPQNNSEYFYLKLVDGEYEVVNSWSELAGSNSVKLGKKCTVSFSSGDSRGLLDEYTGVYGETIELAEFEFSAPAGKSFVGWTENGSDDVLGDTYILKGDSELIANWENDTSGSGGSSSSSSSNSNYNYFNITARAGEGGSISPVGMTSVRMGYSQSYIITPDEGYVVADVLVDGKSVGAVTGYTFDAVYTEHVIEAQFAKENAGGDSETEPVKVDNSFGKMRLKSNKSTKTRNRLVWGKVKDADGYVVYGAQCNTKTNKYEMKKLAVIKDGKTNTYVDKNLKEGTYYKYCVKAYKLVDGKKVFISKSKTIHVTTAGGQYGNVKAVDVNATEVTLNPMEVFTIVAGQKKNDKNIDKHRVLNYESSNTDIATVDKNGIITAKKAGTCYIYVYAQNGIYTKVKVTVE